MGKHWDMSDEGRAKISAYAKERYKNNSLVVNCGKCQASYKVAKSRYDNGRGRYCSKKCMYVDKKGVRYSPDTEFKKGQNGPLRVTWKGDNAGYAAKHLHNRKYFEKPGQCEWCGYDGPSSYEWANISGGYYREREDWAYLCKVCHNRWDRVAYKAWATKRAKR